MAETTYLRYIRLKCGITLMELEEHSSFSNQYLSLLELGRANCTPRNAETLRSITFLPILQMQAALWDSLSCGIWWRLSS